MHHLSWYQQSRVLWSSAYLSHHSKWDSRLLEEQWRASSWISSISNEVHQVGHCTPFQPCTTPGLPGSLAKDCERRSGHIEKTPCTITLQLWELRGSTFHDQNLTQYQDFTGIFHDFSICSIFFRDFTIVSANFSRCPWSRYRASLVEELREMRHKLDSEVRSPISGVVARHGGIYQWKKMDRPWKIEELLEVTMLNVGSKGTYTLCRL